MCVLVIATCHFTDREAHAPVRRRMRLYGDACAARVAGPTLQGSAFIASHEANATEGYKQARRAASHASRRLSPMRPCTTTRCAHKGCAPRAVLA